MNPNIFFSNFSGASGISRQNPRISRQKSLIPWASRDIPNFLAPTPSRGRPLPHQKISGLKSLGLCSFFVPEPRLQVSQANRATAPQRALQHSHFQLLIKGVPHFKLPLGGCGSYSVACRATVGQVVADISASSNAIPKRHINTWHINNFSVTPVTDPPGRVPESSRPGTRTKMFMFLGFRTQQINF